VKARGSFIGFDHPRAGKVRMAGTPVRLSRTPSVPRTPAPLHGQHTEEVLREAGLTPGEIETLRATGAAG